MRERNTQTEGGGSLCLRLTAYLHIKKAINNMSSTGGTEAQ